MLSVADDQVVFHGKNIRDLVGSNAGEILVRLAVDCAFQSDITVFDDDMNGRHGLNGIAREARIAIDRAVKCAAKLIIHRRRRQNLDVVHYRGNSFNAFNDGLVTWPYRVTLSPSTL